MKTAMKKKDWMLIVIILLAAGIAYLSHALLKDTASAVVVVRVDGKIVGTFDLAEDKKVTINNGSNVFIINNGKADMIEADCPDQLCVHQRPVSGSGESIICLPNRVVLEVKSKAESEIDAVTN